MANLHDFENAAAVVAQWFDGREHVRREPVKPSDTARSWVIDLPDDFAQVRWVRLILPSGFPIEPCRFEIDPHLELKLPHVERGGKLCLGISAYPEDLAGPVAAVLRGMAQLRDEFLQRVLQPGWAEAEFQKERLTYWSLHCTDKRRPTRVDERLGPVHFDMTGLDTWSFGSVAGYLHPATESGRFYRHVVACGDNDPDAVARRHGWACCRRLKVDHLEGVSPTEN